MTRAIVELRSIPSLRQSIPTEFAGNPSYKTVGRNPEKTFTMTNSDHRTKIIELKKVISDNFTAENWLELGVLTDCSEIVSHHPRLLRSLSFGDEDYSGCVLDVLLKLTARSQENLEVINGYVESAFGIKREVFISAKHADGSKRITFCPTVFKIPDVSMEEDRIAAMMPFGGFDGVYKAMGIAAQAAKMKIDRADTVWDDSTFIQDIFSLIFKSNVIIVDMTNRNPNVMYEMGIAHTLGRNVIPITQNISDIPSDLGHHRALKYLNNAEGLANLSNALTGRLRSIYAPPKQPWDF